MLDRIRQRSREESGFTLVELLVVMLILGILAAIAVPSFFNQRDKARDADAKALVRTAETAMETYATDNGGQYINATTSASPVEADLEAIESSLTNASSITVVSDATSYTVTVPSSTGNTFSIARAASGVTSLTCTTGGQDGCPTGGVWG